MLKMRFNYTYQPENSAVMASLFLGSALCGMAANGFVLYLVRRMRSSWGALSHQLIAAMATIDVTLSLSVFFMCGLRIGIGYPEVFETAWFCPIFGFSLSYFTSVSMLLITTLGLERYLLVCHHKSLPTGLGWAVFGTISGSFGIAALGNSITNAFSPDPTFTYCWPNGNAWSAATNLFITVTFVLSILVLTFCYISILVECYRWNDPSSLINLNVKEHAAKVSRRSAMRAILFIIFYYFCFMPKFISTMWQWLGDKSTHPFVLYILGPFGISLSTAINPMMVIFLHSQFKEEALNVLYPKRISPCIME